MNWYKKARLIDKEKVHKSEEQNQIMPLMCAYCQKWATHPLDPGSVNRNEYIWKTEEELLKDPSDKMDLDQVKRDIAEGRSNISHGYCPECSQKQKEEEELWMQQRKKMK